MMFVIGLHRLLAGLSAATLTMALCGCGGGNGSMISTPPITVSLATSKVVVMQAGQPVTVQISIDSPSETALVMLTGLPGGVGANYAASDTNPSGTLTFTAGATAVLGSYTPIIRVNSAGQMAMTNFTLVVKPKK